MASLMGRFCVGDAVGKMPPVFTLHAKMTHEQWRRAHGCDGCLLPLLASLVSKKWVSLL